MAGQAKRCLSATRIAGLSLRNRLIGAAMFEGRTPGGAPGDALTAFHTRLGRGGIAMTTVAYCAAEADGRLHEHTMHMHEGIAAPLRALVHAVHATGASVSGQLGHAGGFTANPALSTSRPLGPSRGWNPFGISAGLLRVDAMTLRQIRARVDAFAAAAAFMKSVGFDAIELHFGHGYALHQFISPRTNRRTDAYGGSLANRMRMPVEVLTAVRRAVGEAFPLLGKISMSDGLRGGITSAESVEIATILEAAGIDVIVCSAGTSGGNPMLIFRGDSLAPGLIEHEPSPTMRTVLRLAAPVVFKRYPFEETYLLPHAQRIRDRVACGVCYVGGACTAQAMETVMGAGFDLIALGRALLFDPDLPRQLVAQPQYASGCTHCNRCATKTNAPGGIHCVERPTNFR